LDVNIHPLEHALLRLNRGSAAVSRAGQPHDQPDTPEIIAPGALNLAEVPYTRCISGIGERYAQNRAR